MKTKMCVICAAKFDDKWGKRKTCSKKCSMDLQRQTLGRAPSQIHGHAKPGEVERLHNIWRGIIKRCNCPTSSSFSGYGGRGILVCSEWVTDYTAFRSWALESGYKDGLTIGRVDNNGPYSPSNCRWEGRKDQARNRRSSHLETHNGEAKTLAEWAEIYSIPYGTLIVRVNVYGWPITKALTEPIHKAAQYLVAGQMLTLDELANKYHIKPATLRYRLKHMPVEKALEMKPHEKTR